jgi:hypothetical protein
MFLMRLLSGGAVLIPSARLLFTIVRKLELIICKHLQCGQSLAIRSQKDRDFRGLIKIETPFDRLRAGFRQAQGRLWDTQRFVDGQRWATP